MSSRNTYGVAPREPRGGTRFRGTTSCRDQDKPFSPPAASNKFTYSSRHNFYPLRGEKTMHTHPQQAFFSPHPSLRRATPRTESGEWDISALFIFTIQKTPGSPVASLTPQISCEAPVSSSRPFLGVDFTTSKYLQDDSCFPPRKGSCRAKLPCLGLPSSARPGTDPARLRVDD